LGENKVDQFFDYQFFAWIKSRAIVDCSTFELHMKYILSLNVGTIKWWYSMHHASLKLLPKLKW